MGMSSEILSTLFEGITKSKRTWRCPCYSAAKGEDKWHNSQGAWGVKCPLKLPSRKIDHTHQEKLGVVKTRKRGKGKERRKKKGEGKKGEKKGRAKREWKRKKEQKKRKKEGNKRRKERQFYREGSNLTRKRLGCALLPCYAWGRLLLRHDLHRKWALLRR